MKKLFSLLLCVVMVLSLVACGSKTDDAQTPDEPQDTAPELSGTMKVVATGDVYGPLFDAFTADTGVEVECLSMSSGEVLSKLRAEGGTPSADLWFGGGIDAFMSAKDDGLLEPVTFDAAAELGDEYKDTEGYWYSKGITIVGFLLNNSLMEELGLTAPESWDDLTDSQYAGEIDMSISVDATDVQNVKANKELMALEKTSVSVEYLAMNCEKEPFNDPKVRQAINYALNQQEIIDVVLEGRGQVANSVMNVNIPGYSEEITGYSQDLEKAKALMAEAGYPDGFKTTLFASGDVRNREAQIIQAQLLKIGIEVDIQLYEWGAFLDAINKGEHDMFISSWSNATMDPDASIFPLFHTKNFGATGNRAFYSNPEVDTLIEQAQKESDNAKRMELYKEIQQKINDDAPWACLFYGTTCTGIRADLKGFVLHPSSANHYENLYYEK